MLLNTLAAIHWNMDPMIFQVGGFGLRWYSLGFLLAFVCGYFLMSRMFKNEKVENKYLDSLVIYIFLAVLIGARLGHCLFYDFGYYFSKAHWMEILLPFNKNWQFTGYQGLASHGAAIAILIALWLYGKRYKMNPWWLVDRLVIVIALGGAFVRLGNFFNSEIYGVETSLPWGVVFESATPVPETVPKHPTQLYESISYFLIFFVSIFYYIKKKGHLPTGRLFGWWLIALFGIRFVIEFVKSNGIIADHLLKKGQLLSIPFILFGIVLLVLAYKHKLPEHIFLTPNHKPLPDKKEKGDKKH